MVSLRASETSVAISALCTGFKLQISNRSERKGRNEKIISLRSLRA